LSAESEPQSALLSRAVPEVAAAMASGSAAILAQQHRLHENNQLKLNQIHELLLGLTNGHTALRIHGFATFGETPAASVGLPVTLQNNPALAAASSRHSIVQMPQGPPPPAGLAPLTPTPSAEPAPAQPPTYTLMDTYNVQDAWREWEYGIGGHLPVKVLEERWGHHWRPGTKAKVAFCRRKVIWDEIIRLMRSGLTEEVAVAKLEDLRDGKSLYKLHNLLKALQGSTASARKRKRADDS
jgi:hypothetical protein